MNSKSGTKYIDVLNLAFSEFLQCAAEKRAI